MNVRKMSAFAFMLEGRIRIYENMYKVMSGMVQTMIYCVTSRKSLPVGGIDLLILTIKLFDFNDDLLMTMTIEAFKRLSFAKTALQSFQTTALLLLRSSNT